MSQSTTTASAEPIGLEGTVETQRRLSPWTGLALLAATHFLVDVVAGTTNPTWPVLERGLSVPTGGLLWVFVCWSVAASFTQLFFGLWADRRSCRWLIWAGPLVAIVCLSSLGLVQNVWGLVFLFVCGGIGIAAFHPEAAATAGSLMPEQRSRAMALFALSGYIGQAMGPYYSGLMMHHFGLPGLAWGMAWGLPMLFLLWLCQRQLPAPATPPPVATVQGSVASGSGRVLGLLLAIGSLRVIPAMGVPLALAYLLEASSASSVVIGAVQSAFMAGIGAGAMVCAAFVRPSFEFRALWLFPVLAAPLLTILGLVTGWWLVLLVAICGAASGITLPVYISFGQQLLPHGQRLASSVTMGVSWGIGGAAVAAMLRVGTLSNGLEQIFVWFAAASLLSSVLCWFLPRSKT